jgi:hypothetical protein
MACSVAPIYLPLTPAPLPKKEIYENKKEIY